MTDTPTVALEAAGDIEIAIAFRGVDGELRELASTDRGRVELVDYRQR